MSKLFIPRIRASWSWGVTACGAALLAALPLMSTAAEAPLKNEVVAIRVAPEPGVLWSLDHKSSGEALPLQGPVFQVNGKSVRITYQSAPPINFLRKLHSGVREYECVGPVAGHPELTFAIQFRVSMRSPVVRFRYQLTGKPGQLLTKTDGRDAITYFGTAFKDYTSAKEVRLSDFLEIAHSYSLGERALTEPDFEAGRLLPGPIMVGTNGKSSVVLAYEHGAQIPDAYLEFHAGAGRRIEMRARKGNYLDGKDLSVGGGFQSVWFDAGIVEGGEDKVAQAFRTSVLHDAPEFPGTRDPIISYNTWCYQERNRWWNGKPYLASMNNERILAEIDVAHRLGIEVFVIDTGWYEATGDWRVSKERFPDGLKAVREKLAAYGMRLGLWFDFGAAVSSQALKANRASAVSLKGQERHAPVWETEDSYRMCVVSDYADAFANRLIELHRELGVTYFKWDAIGQHECDSPNHRHGTNAHSPQERLDSYAYQLPTMMAKIVEKVASQVPNAIVDFDVTEGGRAFGLGFLSAGRYFLINNGPYYHNYDVPTLGNTAQFKDRNPQAVIQTENWNLFFFPGPARTWICRLPLTLDRWVPSILLMTHYYPDDPEQYQMVNLASLVLGQNGIWGDLLAVSPAGVKLIGDTLGLYRQVRADMAEASPVVTGNVSGSPEIHEKIAANGRGGVSLFAPASGEYDYITEAKPSREVWTSEGVTVDFLPDGRARIRAKLPSGGAAIVFFGVKA